MARGGIAPRLLTSALDASGQLHASAALPLGKIPWYPFYRRLGGPQRHSGRCEVEKTLLPLPGIESRFLGCPARSPVATYFKALTLHHQILMSSSATFLCCVLCHIVLEAEGSNVYATSASHVPPGRSSRLKPDSSSQTLYTVTYLINALPGSSSVITVHYATIEEAVFSMSSAPSNSRNGVV
jgi:hypothetical protein